MPDTARRSNWPPDDASIHHELGDAFERHGRPDQAVAAWRTATLLEGESELATLLAGSYAECGFAAAVQAVTRERLQRLDARAGRGEYVSPIEYVRAYVRLGETEPAFEWLDRAAAERNVSPLMVNSDPFYDSLRPDRRFAEFVRRTGLTR